MDKQNMQLAKYGAETEPAEDASETAKQALQEVKNGRGQGTDEVRKGTDGVIGLPPSRGLGKIPKPPTPKSRNAPPGQRGVGGGGPAIIFWKLGGSPVESVDGFATVASMGCPPRWDDALECPECLECLEEADDTDDTTDATSLPERILGFIRRSMPDSTAAEGGSPWSMIN